MPYPKEYWDAEAQAQGKVWREFMGVLRPYLAIGIDAVTDLVHFYCEENRSDSEGSFLSNLPSIWRDQGDRRQIEEDLGELRLGLDVWDRHGEELAGAVAEHDKVSLVVGRDRARECWFSRTSGQYDSECWADVMARIYKDTNPEGRLPRRGQKRLSELYWCGMRLRRQLHFVLEIEAFRSVARKTWPARAEERQEWTWDEFEFCDTYYSDQQPSLTILDFSREADSVDPAKLVPHKREQSVPFAPTLGLNYVSFVVMRAVTIDFVEELTAYNMFKAAKGSFSCRECGQFVPRTFYGRGQLYCTAQCKRRAAKRRQREKAKETAGSKAWAKRAVEPGL